VNPVWSNAALDALADIWVAATSTDRNEIERAVHEINRELADDPANKGESRSGSARALIESPLTVWYRVLPGPQARVFSVLRHGQGPKSNTTS
jgi:hypothetical protein